MATHAATVYYCDAPACQNYEVAHSKDDMIQGYFVDKGHWDNGSGGGPIPKTYACCLDHLGPATRARIEAEW